MSNLFSHLNEQELYAYSKSWEVNYLKQTCKKLGIETNYLRYRYRLRISNISLLMCGDTFIVLSHIFLLLFTVERISLVRVDIFYLFLSLMLSLFLITVNFNQSFDLTNKHHFTFYANIVFVLLIVSRDIVIMTYHKIVEDAELIPFYLQIAVVTVYYFLPFRGYVRKILFTQFIFSIYVIQSKTFYYQEHGRVDIKIVDFIDSFHLCSHILGLFYLVCYEYIIRMTLLNRYYLLEETIHLKRILKREDAMIRTILPTEITRSMQQNIRKIIKENIRRHETSLSFTRTLYVETHNEVSILFADLVNFTHLTTTLSVKKLVEILHELYIEFDFAAESFYVTRIKLLGDCYNCVGGIPKYIECHAKCCVDMGLEMVNIVKEVSQSYELDFDIRIGIHSGAVFSGVIGTAKWHYDIWSKDVDIANRMETYGLPGHVHVSEDTLNLLDDCYDYERGTEAARHDEILKRYDMSTFLILGIKDPQSGYPSIIQIRHSRSILQFPIKKSFSDISNHSISHDYLRRMVIAEIEQEVEKMPIGRSQLTRLCDFSIQPENEDEDAELRNYVTYFWLMFHRRMDEWKFINVPDDLLKYSVLIAFFLSVLISIRARNQATFKLNYPYYIVVCLLLLFFAFIITYKKLWLIFISKSSSDRPKGKIGSHLFKLEDIIKRNFFARVIIYVSLVCILLSLCCFQMMNCNKNEFNFVLAEALLMDTYIPFCFEPIVFTYSIEIVLLFCYSFRMLPLIVIMGVSNIVFIGYLIAVLVQYGFIFERTNTTNLGFRSEYAACFNLLCLLILLFLRERKKTFMAKLDFISKKNIFKKQTRINISTLSIQMILNNMLPKHVANQYIVNSLDTHLFTEEFPKIAIMFASIRNYDPEKIGIRILNEIISRFDDLLLKYNDAVEKIKVASWTYMACCGLDIAAKGGSIVPLQNLTESVQYSITASRMSKLTRKTSTYIKEDDVVVLIMTEFALDLLSIMSTVSKLDMFKNSLLDTEKEGTLRIGISHGPIMAGIVGKAKPHYDIWGNSVNLASRMDATGVNGKIQITENTATILRGFDIKCDYHGITFVKGIGHIPTYFVATDENFDFISIEQIEYPQNREFRRSAAVKNAIFKRPSKLVNDFESNSSDSDWESQSSNE